MTIQIREQELTRICLEELTSILEEKIESEKLIEIEDLPKEFQKPLTPEDY